MMKITAIAELLRLKAACRPVSPKPSTVLMLNALVIAIGVALIATTLNDVFQVVVMPRATGRRYRISFYVWRVIWYVWPKVAWRLYAADSDRREDFLAVFAPLMLVSMLGLWVVLLIFGFALVMWGMRSGITPAHGSFGTMLYFAGTSLLTIGFGDVVGRSSAPRLVSVLAALAGLSFLSIMTAFLFASFGSFQQRETFVVTVAARAGTPPSGVNLLAIAGYSLTREDLSPLMIDAQRWAAAVMESHLAYPMLAYFRSSHDDQSWIGTLGTLLDAATLLMTTVDGIRDGQARIFYNVGRHATRDLSRYFGVETPQGSVGIERQEFEHACDRLVAAGYALYDRDEAWQRFANLRATYAPHLGAMASFFEIPPLQWIGDRSALVVSTHGETSIKIHDRRPSDGETS
ncbi:MAG: two pore domain potassium channel family protein [Candidatus Eremiobacteraeota bacterium]|nr:two pore domain potassium channel family protein [Candidatus Eremiobacteraeota bacterium]